MGISSKELITAGIKPGQTFGSLNLVISVESQSLGLSTGRDKC